MTKIFINPTATVNDFHKDMKVTYVPTHAHCDISHKDCENGIVSSINDKFVFVKYIRHDILQLTAEATDPKELIILTTKK